MSLTDFEDEKDAFDRLERLEDLTREQDDYYWKMGSGLDNDTNLDTNDSDYSADNAEPQDVATSDSGRHR